MADPYDILGVARNASEADIKKAFRGLAKKFHPDRHGGDEGAAKKFKEISGAYDLLGDPQKRAKYDRGEVDEQGNPRGFDPRGGGGPFGGGGGPFGGGARDFEFNWPGGQQGGGSFKPEDIFADLFGGRSRRAQPQRGEDFRLAVTVSFEEAARGGTRRVTLPDRREMEIRIPAGLRDGQQIRLKGQGGQGGNGGPQGDVLIQVAVAAHPFWVRDGQDIRMDLPVTLQEAVLGGKVEVPTLSGAVSLSVPPHSNTGASLRLRGKGIPAGAGKAAGDMYVRLVVTLPEKDAALDDFVREWKTQYDPRGKIKGK